jgi:DNA-directed RNA polymerase specialized sigma subunit
VAGKYHINQKEFFNEIVKSKEKESLTPRALEMFMVLTDKLSNALSYKNPDDKDDCKAFAMMDLILYWNRFNPEKSTNAFAYFTQICKNGMAKGWNQLYRQVDMGKIAIDKETGVYNI